MASTSLSMLSIALAFLLIFQSHAAAAAEEPRKVYIVFVDPIVKAGPETVNLFLEKVLVGSTPAKSLVYSYNNINAFAALLTQNEAKELARLKGILQVLPSKWYHLDSSPSRAPVESNTKNFGGIDGLA